MNVLSISYFTIQIQYCIYKKKLNLSHRFHLAKERRQYKNAKLKKLLLLWKRKKHTDANKISKSSRPYTDVRCLLCVVIVQPKCWYLQTTIKSQQTIYILYTVYTEYGYEDFWSILNLLFIVIKQYFFREKLHTKCSTAQK